MAIILYIPELFGISIEVYFILLILGIPFYFVFRRLFRNRIANRKNRLIATWVATVIFAPLFYIALVVGIMMIASYHSNRDFSQKQWFANKESRYEYSENIIESKMLLGKTKAQIIQILGDEGNIITDNSWYYDLGTKPGPFNIDPDSLVIYFSNGKVVNVEQHEG